jgi:hypothetical protein
MTNSIRINGVTITGGRNVSVSGGKLIVDGQDVTPDAKDISIHIVGNVQVLSVDHADMVNVRGDCGSVKTMTAAVRCRSVNGSVKTMSGTVIAKSVKGDVSTMSANIFIDIKE